jgi:hypothetical protein
MQAVAVSQTMQSAPDNHLRRCVPPTHTGHSLTARRRA